MTQMKTSYSGYQSNSCQCLEHSGVRLDVLVRLNACSDIHVTPDLLTPSTAISALILTFHILGFHGLTIERDIIPWDSEQSPLALTNANGAE